MTVSVILCTFNRSQSLAKTLESLAVSVLPESVAWEVLVIDNNSSDTTREVAESFCQRDPIHFRYLFEPTSGKSHALNRGIREAKGQILAFTDDDLTVEATWLQNLTARLCDGEWAGAGGRILTEKAFSAPRWIPRNRRDALAPLAVFDPGLEAGPLNESPFGANMAYRRRVFQEYGGFRTDLGPGVGHGNLQKSEDNEFGYRLRAAGERLRYEPSALVYHSVPPDRIKQSYFLNWWFQKSRSDILAFGLGPEFRWFVAGIPLGLVRRLAVWWFRWMITIEPSRRFDCKIKVWQIFGGIVESRKQPNAGRTAKPRSSN